MYLCAYACLIYVCKVLAPAPLAIHTRKVGHLVYACVCVCVCVRVCVCVLYVFKVLAPAPLGIHAK